MVRNKKFTFNIPEGSKKTEEIALNSSLSLENENIENKRVIESLKDQVRFFNKINMGLKIIQFLIINITFFVILRGSWLVVRKLIDFTDVNHYAIFVLGSFGSISVVSLYYICGSVMKAIFNDHSDSKGHANIVEKVMRQIH